MNQELLEQYLYLIIDYLGLKKKNNYEKDVAILQEYTKIYFTSLMNFLLDFKIINNNITVPSYYKNIINESSEQLIVNVNNFSGSLYPPQKAVIERMIYIENNPIEIIQNNFKVIINTGLLSERFSFGKTYLLAAFCAHASTTLDYENCYLTLTSKLFKSQVYYPSSIIVSTNKNIPSIITTLKLTNLKWKCIYTLKDIETIDIKEHFDIYVIKDGQNTYLDVKTWTVNHFLLKFNNNPIFTRVIYDDYDMLNLKNNARMIFGRFIWFTSATGKNLMGHNSEDDSYSTIINSSQIIFNMMHTIKCNVNYSCVEFNIPKFDIFTTKIELVDLISNIIQDTEIPKKRCNKQFKKFITSDNDVPYVYHKDKIKILVSIENKNICKDLVKTLESNGITALYLTKVNLQKFQNNDFQVGISPLIHGVNLAFLSHIIVLTDDYNNHQIYQIIGRGQRIGRKENLQVYLKTVSEFRYERHNYIGDGDKLKDLNKCIKYAQKENTYKFKSIIYGPDYQFNFEDAVLYTNDNFLIENVDQIPVVNKITDNLEYIFYFDDEYDSSITQINNHLKLISINCSVDSETDDE